MFVFLKSDHVMEFLIGQVENLNGVKLLENFLPDIFNQKRLCTGCQQRAACVSNLNGNQGECSLFGQVTGDSVCRDCCEDDCTNEINQSHPMLVNLQVQPTTAPSNSHNIQHNQSLKMCEAVYSPNGKPYLHGEIWGAGKCPSWGSNPGGPMYEWRCEDGQVKFTQPCIPINPQGKSIIFKFTDNLLGTCRSRFLHFDRFREIIMGFFFWKVQKFEAL